MNLGSLTCCFTLLTFIGAYGFRSNAFANVDNIYLSKALNKFGGKLYKLASRDTTGNIIVCPISTLVTLYSVTNWASPNVSQEYWDALEINYSDYMLKKYKDLINNLTDGSFVVQNGPTLENSAEGKAPGDSFLQNFTANESINKVDAYSMIQIKSLGRAKRNIHNNHRSQDLDDFMIIGSNAVINDRWQEKFSKYGTSLKEFITNEGRTYVPTMSTESYFSYGRVPGIRATSLKLNFKDRKYSMLIILPDDINGLQSVEEELLNLSLDYITQNNQMTHVELELPKFNIDFTIESKTILKEIGFKNIFTDNLTDFGAYDSNMIEKIYIDIREGEVEGAIDNYSFVPVSLSTGVRFKVNRPFHFKIIKRINYNVDVVIFVGSIRKLYRT